MRSVDELLDGLEKLADGTKKAVAGEGAQRVLFVFTGQGAQWKGVGDSLMSFPVYSKVGNLLLHGLSPSLTSAACPAGCELM